MPTVPKFPSNQVQESALPNIRMNTDAPLSFFGGGAGEQAAFGAAAKSIGSDVFDIQKAQAAEKKKADDVMADYATQKLIEKKNERGWHKDTGAFNKRGENAIGVIDEYIPLFDKDAADIEKSLSNEEQKAKFKVAALKERNEFGLQLNKHIATESYKLDDERTEYGVGVLTEDTSHNWQEPDKIDFNAEAARKLIRDNSQRNGKPSEFAAIKEREAASKIYGGAIDSMLSAKQPFIAEETFNKYKDHMTPEARDKTQKQIEREVLDVKAEGIANRVFDKEGYTDKGAAYERLSEIKDPEIKKAAIEKINTKIAMYEQGNKENVNRLRVDVARLIDGGVPMSNINQDIQGRLTPKDRKAFEILQNQKNGVLAIKPDVNVYHKYDSMGAGDLGKLGMGDLIVDVRPYVDKAQFNRLTAKWEAAKAVYEGDDKAKTVWAGFKNEDEVLFRTMQGAKIAGIDGSKTKDKLNERQKIVLNELQNEINDKALLWSKNNSNKKPDPDMIQKITNDVVKEKALKVNVEGRFFGESEKPIAELYPNERDRVFVPIEKIPETDTKKMLNILKANNQTHGLSDDELLSIVKEGKTPLGKTLRDRIQKAYGAHTIGNTNQLKDKLLGK